MLIVTREALLKAAGFKPARDLRRALKRTRQALNATRKGEPDHALRLSAADRIFQLADVMKPRQNDPDPQRPVNVNIVLAQTSSAPAQLESKGLVLSFPLPESTQQSGQTAEGAA